MDEHFVVVWPVDVDNPQEGVVASGCVTRDAAHSIARVPHATVQVIPYLPGKGVLIHQRPDFVRNSPRKWDVLGGHVSFEMGVLREGFADGLGRVLDQVLSPSPLGQEIAAALAACQKQHQATLAVL